jgi:hypothetical protein
MDIQYSILFNISILSLLAPIIIGTVRFKVLSREIKLLVIYLIIGFTIAVSIKWFIQGSWMWIILHINTLVEYLVVIFIIYSWQESHRIKNLLKILIWSYILFWCSAKVSFEPISGLYSITSSISQVILALSAGYTLFVVIGNYTQPILHYQLFWILIAFILNYIGTLIPTALAGVLFAESGDALVLLYSINWVLVIFSNILFAIGILCPTTQQ